MQPDSELMTENEAVLTPDRAAVPSDDLGESDAKLDAFAARCRALLAEAIEDNDTDEAVHDVVVAGVSTLLTCHDCGAPGVPPCDCADPDLDAELRALIDGGPSTPPGRTRRCRTDRRC